MYIIHICGFNLKTVEKNHHISSSTRGWGFLTHGSTLTSAMIFRRMPMRKSSKVLYILHYLTHNIYIVIYYNSIHYTHIII